MIVKRPSLPSAIASTGVVAILRAQNTALMPSVIEVLRDEGLTAAEVALTTPHAVAAIEALVREFGESACVGAGTVLTAVQARLCIDAGAAFLVAPSVVPDVLAVAGAAGVPCFPGALTPTEVVAGWSLGACAVKVFPASLGGPAYIRALREPLPDVRVVPTGGVSLDQVADYVGSGAAAVGLGSALIGSALHDGDLDSLRDRARLFHAAVSVARQDRTSKGASR